MDTMQPFEKLYWALPGASSGAEDKPLCDEGKEIIILLLEELNEEIFGGDDAGSKDVHEAFPPAR